jgi:Protein of unknown function (DUF2894)
VTTPSAEPPADRAAPAEPRNLADLLAYIARHTAPAGELKAVRDYRGTWVRLGMEQRLRQSGTQVPDNAGPLNTQRLLHQALTVMRDASPAYFQQFMGHVETLLALEALSQPPAAAKKDAARGARRR